MQLLLNLNFLHETVIFLTTSCKKVPKHLKKAFSMSLPWYKDGLKFKCTECGKCCTGTQGFVWVTEEEISKMAADLNLDIKTFKIRYVRNRDNRYALVEKKNGQNEYDCIFLKDKKCAVYKNRPSQCRTYPWWPENLNAPQSWALAAESCEGISNQAPLVPYSEIEKNLKNK